MSLQSDVTMQQHKGEEVGRKAEEEEKEEGFQFSCTAGGALGMEVRAEGKRCAPRCYMWSITHACNCVSIATDDLSKDSTNATRSRGCLVPRPIHMRRPSCLGGRGFQTKWPPWADVWVGD